MRVSEYIAVFNFAVAVRAALLYHLGGIEVNEVLSDYLLGDLVACRGSHSVSHYRAVLRDSDIGSTCADIYESNIYKAYLGRNDNVHRRDRLQSETCDLKPVEVHYRVKTFYDNIRQECGNKLYRRFFTLVSLKAYYLVIVKKVAYDRMSDAVEYRSSRVGRVKLRLCFLYRLDLHGLYHILGKSLAVGDVELH